jgi:thiamine-monophosphate kinase
LNELEIIDLIRRTFKDQGTDLADDVSFVREWASYLVFKTDMFVGATDMPPGMTVRQAARKAVVSSVSDILCKGAVATGFMVSLGIPRRLSDEADVRRMSLGLLDASREYGVPLLGGDVNEADDLIIDVAIVGRATRRVRRSGAKEGDVLVATGPFGYTALGLRHLINKGPMPGKLRRAALARVYRPTPNPRICRRLIEEGLVDASMDSSDGLAITLNEIAKQSVKGILVTALPTDGQFLKACEAAGLDPEDLVFRGGEEYEAILAITKGGLPAALRVGAEAGVKLYPFGEVRAGKVGVAFRPSRHMRPREVGPVGWVHLS